MFSANQTLLKATVTKDVMDVQNKIVQLYATNLASIGTQCALVAGLSYSALTTTYIQDDILSDALAYIYLPAYTISLLSALIAMSHTVIASMFGPSKALLGIASGLKNGT